MLDGKLVLLHVLRRRIADLFVPLNLDDENAVALLDEEVRAEFPALWVFAFLPGIFDGVEADRRILQPRVPAGDRGARRQFRDLCAGFPGQPRRA